MKTFKVIDISKYQGAVDFKKVKADGVDAVILRCGYTGYGKAKKKSVDSRWESNYKSARAAGLPVGAYYYSCATSEDEAKSEAEFVLELIKDKKIDYPVFWDTEDNHNTEKYSPESQLTIGKERLTKVGLAFLNTLERNCIRCGVYASTSWLNNQLDMKKLGKYDVWVAQYAAKVTYRGDYTIWQYTSRGKVNGVEGNVDMNICYVDYVGEAEKGSAEELKRGDSSFAVLNYKMLLAVAKELEIVTQGVDDNGIFGAGTELATKQLQKELDLCQSGRVNQATVIAAKDLINGVIASRSERAI